MVIGVWITVTAEGVVTPRDVLGGGQPGDAPAAAIATGLVTEDLEGLHLTQGVTGGDACAQIDSRVTHARQ